MRSLKRIIAVMTVLSLVFAFAACGKNNGTAETVTASTEAYTDVPERTENTKIVCTRDATAIGLVQLRKTRSYSMDVTYVDTVQESYDEIKSGEADIAGLTLDLAAKLYNETDGGIKILSVSAEVSLYVCSKSEKLENIGNLKGKTIVTSGENTYYQYFLESLLLQNNLEAGKDVEIEYLPSFQDVAAKAVGDDAPEFVIVPAHYAFQIVDTSDEPVEGKYVSALSLRKIWEKTSDLVPACECIVARSEYIEENPEYISEFMEYEEVSVNFINSNEKAGDYLTEAGVYSDAGIVSESIGYCNVVFIEKDEMQTLADENFSFLNGINPDTVGGKIPDAGIYYM